MERVAHLTTNLTREKVFVSAIEAIVSCIKMLCNRSPGEHADVWRQQPIQCMDDVERGGCATHLHSDDLSESRNTSISSSTSRISIQ